MHKLKVGNLKLPLIFVAKDEDDAYAAKQVGVPYIIWDGDQDSLVRLIMRPTLEKMFPHVNWERMYRGLPKMPKINTPSNKTVKQFIPTKGTMDYLEKLQEAIRAIENGDKTYSDYKLEEGRSGRVNDGGTVCTSTPDEIVFYDQDLHDAVGDMTAQVNIEELQVLGLLPQWLSQVANAVRRMSNGTDWEDGYNKKLGACVGNHTYASMAPNLIILDVSASIPEGISATMLSLIATLRNQADADLIVTGSTSGWYPKHEPLPSPQSLRAAHGRSNESAMFNEILKTHVLGKHWGNVICFGDSDTPQQKRLIIGSTTKVDKIFAFCTYPLEPEYRHRPLCERKWALPGYCRWANLPGTEIEWVDNWVSWMS